MHLSYQVKQFVAKAPHAVLAVAILCCLTCGKRKPPLPPEEKVLQRPVVSGFQRGNQVVLSWKMPMKNAPKGDLLHIERAEIYRLAEPLSAPQSLSEEEFASRGLVVANLRLTESDFGGKTLQFTDTLQFAGQPARLRYSVRFVNGSGQRAAFSNFFLLEPAAKVSSAPTSLTADVSQEAVRLAWQGPTNNVDGSTPANLIGYNVYRSESETVPAKLLNSSPITVEEFSDRFFEFEKDFYYFVRAVSLGSDAQPVESGESNILKLRPVDNFPPSAPASVTVAATTTTVSIFFPVNPEKDIAGYRIYRSTDSALPKEQWELLTKEALTFNTFQDTAVESGRTYYYYVTAIDRYNNISEPSEVVSETIP